MLKWSRFALVRLTKPGKTEDKFIGTVNCRKNNILGDMRATKKSWGKTGGRQYKHFIQSFSPDENITPEEAHIIAEELVNKWDKFKGYEVCFATHTDRNHIHSHIVVNSVSFENGKKFNYSKRELQQFKDLSDRIIAEHGKEICRKNDEITTSNIGAYKAIEKAAQGEYDSWLLNIVTAVISAKDKATSQSEFVSLLEQQNIKTVWQDNRKHITFSDSENHKVRNKKLSETFKLNLDKEVLLNEFESNYERETAGATQTFGSAENDLGGNRADRQQLRQYNTRRNISDGQRLKSDGYEGDNFEAAIDCLRNAIAESESKVRADESRRENRSLDEKSRQSQRERSQSEKGNSRKNKAEDKSYNLQIEASKQSRIAAEEKEKARDARIEKSVAEDKCWKAEKSERETKSRYRAGFVGIEIFTTAVAFMELVKHATVLKECGKWFLNRINNLIWIVIFLKNIFFKLENLIAVKFSTNTIVSYSIAVIIYLAVGTALIFLSLHLLSKVKKIIYNIQKAYKYYPNDELKFFSSVATATALFYGCIFFYEPITRLIPLNILSLWLIVTILEMIAFNYTTISLGLSYSLY